MKTALAILACTLPPLAVSADTFGVGTANEFAIEFVNITRGTLADDTGFGAVGHDYQIAKYEVSAAMFDAYNALSAGPIIDSASTGSSPATRVSWVEAARFVNWLNSSSGFPQAYKFTGNGIRDGIELWDNNDPGYDPNNLFRNRNAHYFLPSENEWYRAAYYDPTAEIYWDYPTGSDTPPAEVSGGTAPGTAVYRGGVLNPGAPAPITSAGGLSPFGTMAQGGNVDEWTESASVPPNDSGSEARAMRGGWWGDGAQNMASSHRNNSGHIVDNAQLTEGFRVAAVLPDTDGDGIADAFETNTGQFVSIADTGTAPADPDSDDDGLLDGAEVHEHRTNPNLPDTDGDGFTDSFELNTGFDPTSSTNTPDTLSSIGIAVEFQFAAALGATYRIEATADLQEWTIIEDGIAGNGAAIVRFYSLEGTPRKFFRARKN